MHRKCYTGSQSPNHTQTPCSFLVYIAWGFLVCVGWLNQDFVCIYGSAAPQLICSHKSVSLPFLERAYFRDAFCYLVLGAAGRDNRSLLTSLIWASSVSVASASSPSWVWRLLMDCASSSSLRLELVAWRLYSSTMQPPPMMKMIASPSSSAPSSAAASSFRGLMEEPRKPMILIFVLISIQWYAMEKTRSTTSNYLTD